MRHSSAVQFALNAFRKFILEGFEAVALVLGQIFLRRMLELTKAPREKTVNVGINRRILIEANNIFLIVS